MPMKKKAERGATRRKLSPQLNFLLSLGLPTVRRLALATRTERQKQSEKIKELLAQACAEQDPTRRLERAEEIRLLIEGIGAPLVHGVYFPTDDGLADDAPVRLKKPYV